MRQRLPALVFRYINNRSYLCNGTLVTTEISGERLTQIPQSPVRRSVLQILESEL